MDGVTGSSVFLWVSLPSVKDRSFNGSIAVLTPTLVQTSSHLQTNLFTSAPQESPVSQNFLVNNISFLGLSAKTNPAIPNAAGICLLFCMQIENCK